MHSELNTLLLQGLNISFGGIKFSGSENGTELLPPWINIPLFTKGQQFAMDHLPGVVISSLFGLTMLLSMRQISDILIFTGKSSKKRKSGRRYASTLLQVFLWMRSSLSDSREIGIYENIEKSSWILMSLNNVKEIHDKVTLRAKKAIKEDVFYKRVEKTIALYKREIDDKLWAVFHEDLRNSNFYSRHRNLFSEMNAKLNENSTMSQFAFAMTQFSFFGVFLSRLQPTYKDIEGIKGFTHFWAILGYAMGLQDEFNIALHVQRNNQSLKEMQQTLDKILQEFFIPSLFNLGDGSKILIQAFIQGLTEIFDDFPFNDKEFLLRRMLGDVLKIETPGLNARRDAGAKDLDFLMAQGLPQLFPGEFWDPIISPIASLYHYKIGRKYFGDLYSSDGNVAKYCYY